MKILFYRYGSICEPDILETFIEYGFEVTEVTEEIHNKNFTSKEGIGLVSKLLMDKPQDMVFSINFYPFLSEVCNIMKIRYVCWVVDSPVIELYSPSIKNPWNRVFIFDHTLYEEIVPMNPKGVFYMPLAVNVSQKQNAIKNADNKMRQKYSSDISFVGSLYTEKCHYQNFLNPSEQLRGYLDGLMEAQLLVYGYYFIDEILKEEDIMLFRKYTKNYPELSYETARTNKALVSQFYIGSQISVLERRRLLKALSEEFEVDLYTGSDISLLPRIHGKGLVKTQTEMPIVFHESRINLNITAKSIRSGIPLRIWDVLGCSGFCITNYQSELEEYFAIGEEIETYSSKEELLDKCHYYLEHETKRQEIAKNAFNKIQSHHTYLIRMGQLMELALAPTRE